MMERIVLFCLVLLNTCFDISSAFTSKHTMEILDYIEDRLNVESNRINVESVRINVESKLRKEGFNLLLNKVESIETMLNKILEKIETQTASSEISDKTKSDISSNKIMTILLNSFKTEKFENKRFKREILQDVNKQADEIKEVYASLENSVNNMQKEIGLIKQQTLQHQIDLNKLAGQLLQNFEENAKNTTALINSTLQNTETILVDMNKTGELIKDREHVHEIMQTQLENGKYACLNETRSLTKNLEEIVKLLKKNESCLDLYISGFRLDGIYKIQIGHEKTNISVYCDMTTDGGGWTVFQRRQDGSEDLFRDWNDYKYGFGKLDGEFWLGNEYINLLTDDGMIHELKIDIEDFGGDRAYAKYTKFKIGPEKTNYTLEVSGYTGNADDSLNYNHNGMQFTTKDRDNELHPSNCASAFGGGWWYEHCFVSHLNGVYSKQKVCTSFRKCIFWQFWKGWSNNLKFTKMKLR